ncbi:amidohydrolase family protein [bacterium]|nr:amidohydrolase family protein [bacterium]
MKRILLGLFLGLIAVLVLLVSGFALLLLLPVPDPPAPKKSAESVVISNAFIVDLQSDSISRRTILIENGRITWIGHHDSLAVPEAAEIVDASGQYLIPGLWDMHTHVGSRMAPKLSFPLFIANGVTNIRDMGGHAPFKDKQQWTQRILANELLGPRFQSKAGLFVGQLSSEQQTKARVQRFPSVAPDFIKVYNAVLPEFYFLLLQEAGKRSIPVLGHKPRAVKAVDAVRAGHKSFEHARLFLFECYPGAEELRKAYLARYLGKADQDGRLVTTKVMREMLDTHSDSLFRALADEMIAHNTYYCPTHITRKMDAFADNQEYRRNPRLKYIDRLRKMMWNRDADGMVDADPTPVGRETFMEFYLKGLELTGKAHEAGVKILAGTDANDTYCFPGLGIHDELQELVKAGLTPAEALRSATILPVEYFELTHDYGTVDSGKVADLVLLKSNPLVDIANTQKITTVIYNGNIYTRKDLNNQLAYVEELALSWRVVAQLLWSQMK